MLATGTELGGYRIEGVLGRGGMGVVYEAVQLSLERVVALKLLATELSLDPGFRDRFRREARTQAIIEHAHIVPVFEAGELPQGLYIAMRLIRGPNLKQLIAGGDLEPGRAVRILMPLADALDAAHEADLIHRDIKPQNILVGRRDHAFLADFGLTKGKGDTGYTRTGQLMGTVDYIAPEQIKGELATGASDIYALAAVAYECLVGRPPFARQTELATLYAHVSDPLPQASVERPGLPAAIDEVLAAGLAKNPAERPDTALELVTALDAALAATIARTAPAVAEPDGVSTQPLPERAPAPDPTPPAGTGAGQATEIVAPSGVPTREDLRRGWSPDVAAAAASADAVREREREAEQRGGARERERRERERAASAEAERAAAAEARQAAADQAEQAVTEAEQAALEAEQAAAERQRAEAATGDAPRSSGSARRAWWVAVPIAVAAAVAIGVAAGSPAEEEAPLPPPARPTVTAQPVSFQGPAGWRASEFDGLPPLRFEGDVAAVSQGDGVIASGLALGTGATLLPRDFRQQLGETPEGEPVRLGDLQAYRYDDLRPSGADDPLTVYAAPTTAGVLTLACRGASERACGAAASSVTARAGEPLTLGPQPAYAAAVDKALTAVRKQRAAGAARLAAAERPNGQAEAATEIARAYRAAQRRLAAAQATALEAEVHPLLVRAFRDAGRRWQKLAAAAREYQRSRYRTHRRTVRRSERDIAAAVHALTGLGYRVR